MGLSIVVLWCKRIYFCIVTKSCIEVDFIITENNLYSFFSKAFSNRFQTCEILRIMLSQNCSYIKNICFKIVHSYKSLIRYPDPTSIYKVIISEYRYHNCSNLKMCNLAVISAVLVGNDSPNRCYGSKRGAILVKLNTLLV